MRDSRDVGRRNSGSSELRRVLADALRLGADEEPYPWQVRLLQEMCCGRIPCRLDLPTGLGKTSVMAIWLLARAYARGSSLPRRLVYVVDRRAVVDQATAEAERLREWLSGRPDLSARVGLPNGRGLPISTLRGKYVDNREWLEDPSLPAVIVGTVDMVGSRLLFSGYGVSRKMRPYHAALLGCDTLFVLDEAHLVPPFAELLEVLAGRGRLGEHDDFGPLGEHRCSVVLPLKVMLLSATLVGLSPHQQQPFTLNDEDARHPGLQRRWRAHKRLRLLGCSRNELVGEMVAQTCRLLEENRRPLRVLVYCDTRKHAQELEGKLQNKLNPSRRKGAQVDGLTGVDIVLFTGARRVRERTEAAQQLEKLGFLAGMAVHRDRPAVLVATSAAEVGVDLDADHMVCDLVTWERMVQRLGRVNRQGRGEAEVVVVHPGVDRGRMRRIEESGRAPRSKEEKAQWPVWQKLRAIEHLPRLDDGEARDASPAACADLARRAQQDEHIGRILRGATSTPPPRPRVTRALLETWAMTSLDEETIRPEVAPWLRGWTEDPPQAVLVWRRFLPCNKSGQVVREATAQAYFEAAPPHLSEQLEVTADDAADWLAGRAQKLLKQRLTTKPAEPTVEQDGDTEEHVSAAPLPELTPDTVVVLVFHRDGRLHSPWSLKKIADATKKELKKELQQAIGGRFVLIDARLGGLDSHGLLDESVNDAPTTADGDPAQWGEAPDGGPLVRWRVRVVEQESELLAEAGSNWHPRLRIVLDQTAEGEPVRWLVVDKWRDESAIEDDRASGHPQLLDEHTNWVIERLNAIAERLQLPPKYREVLLTAARWHDVGKQAPRWQEAFHAPAGAVYAKTPGPIDLARLDGYRHEFGSLVAAIRNLDQRGQLDSLSDEEDIALALHLIAAHHGFARPVIRPDACDDSPPSVLQKVADEAAIRFARLQRLWGPWALAWWEALLRAADHQASRDNEQQIEQELGTAAVAGASYASRTAQGGDV